ncbi:glycosyltransferase [Rhodococcus sp. RS1C4]|uniref:glycosyltransferase family 4 protein n=1 Tax=Nocardiaceae TaxID=85025 RepID=UPI0003735677|nr:MULTISPECIES: glycosyltransferase family 4 protein [Rhodococcus]OZC48525.1 glycosyltransferase [Rhodococcus sp. RS1C4]OZC85362.1 glycosyltransferase [Rhodococcus sp. 06-418-1B]OZD12703.1 glycosyltransferase [Rhodococcus sp. 06-156-4C]OZD24325.1 glycosyltransferase [Rhodococcus sp. 06-156-3C]OZD27435.1 glycosyltransferase [Rhodococcus sp. 06-156-4a]
MTDTSTVVFVAHTGQVSGAEKMLLALVDRASETGHTVVVASPGGALATALPDGVRHVTIPELGLGGQRGVARVMAAGQMLARWWSAGRTLRPLVRGAGTATVVNSLFALPATRIARPPRGASWLVHDVMASGRQRAVTRLGRGVVRRAVACTEAAAAPVRAAGLDVELVPYGVPWPVEDFGRESVGTPPVVGMLALLTPWKGHRVLLDALALTPGVEVELAGGSFPSDETYVAELRERASEPDLSGRVRFLGHVKLDDALRRWDVVVSTSVLPEAGPLAVLEAMSHGLPVIATDHGGPTEFLRDGAGVLVPPGDPTALSRAVQDVLSDGTRRATLGARARAKVGAEHNISITMPALLEALIA